MIDLVLDTNVIVDFLRGDNRVLDFWRQRVNGHGVAVSQITRMELLSAPATTESARTSIKSLLQNLIVEGISEAIEEQAVTLRRDCRIKLPDAIIAATAWCLRVPLATGDDDLLRKLGAAVSVLHPGTEQGGH